MREARSLEETQILITLDCTAVGGFDVVKSSIDTRNVYAKSAVPENFPLPIPRKVLKTFSRQTSPIPAKSSS